MNKSERIISISIISILLVGIIIAIIYLNYNTKNNDQINIYRDSNTYEYSDYEDLYNLDECTKITLQGSSIKVDGNGVTVEKSIATITSAGVYYITGTLDNGCIIVNTTENVRIILDNANISYNNGPAIYVKEANKTIITLASESENSLTDGENYVFDNVEKQEPDATLFSKSDLVINGNGKLTINANYKDGIASKDGLKIVSGNIIITSKDNGIRAKDYIKIDNGDITINSNGDGIKITEDSDETKGYFYIDNGSLTITSTQDGIQAQTDLIINGGTINIKSGGGSNVKSSSEESSKGLKGVKSITINGGDILIDSLDDAIHSNGTITINNGEINISTGDDGIHSDLSIVINNGDIDIIKSYEGIESKDITIKDGNIKVISSDDGINASDSTVTTTQNNRGMNNSQNAKITIDGGYIVVDASGDGIDSNGSIYVNGGVIIVNGPTNSSNGALDYDNEFVMNDGTLIAVGSLGMTQTISNSSSVNCILVSYSTVQSENSLVSIQDEANGDILTFAPSKKYQLVVIATKKIESKKTYNIYSGGSYNGTNTDGYYQNGTYSGANKIYSVTINSIVTSVGSTGMKNNVQPNFSRIS